MSCWTGCLWCFQRFVCRRACHKRPADFGEPRQVGNERQAVGQQTVSSDVGSACLLAHNPLSRLCAKRNLARVCLLELVGRSALLRRQAAARPAQRKALLSLPARLPFDSPRPRNNKFGPNSPSSFKPRLRASSPRPGGGGSKVRNPGPAMVLPRWESLEVFRPGCLDLSRLKLATGVAGPGLLCAVCGGPAGAGEAIMALACSHTFCPVCFEAFLRRHWAQMSREQLECTEPDNTKSERIPCPSCGVSLKRQDVHTLTCEELTNVCGRIAQMSGCSLGRSASSTASAIYPPSPPLPVDRLVSTVPAVTVTSSPPVVVVTQQLLPPTPPSCVREAEEPKLVTISPPVHRLPSSPQVISYSAVASPQQSQPAWQRVPSQRKPSPALQPGAASGNAVARRPSHGLIRSSGGVGQAARSPQLSSHNEWLHRTSVHVTPSGPQKLDPRRGGSTTLPMQPSMLVGMDVQAGVPLPRSLPSMPAATRTSVKLAASNGVGSSQPAALATLLRSLPLQEGAGGPPPPRLLARDGAPGGGAVALNGSVAGAVPLHLKLQALRASSADRTPLTWHG